MSKPLIVIIAVMGGAAFFLSAPCSGEEPVAEVKVSHLNMRAINKPDAVIVRVASSGETFPLLEKKGDWVKVAVPSGYPLYLKKEMVEVNDKSIKVVRSTTLWAAPSPSAEVLGRTEAGESFELMEEHGGYVKVRAKPGSPAWVAAKHITIKGEEVIRQSEATTLAANPDGKAGEEVVAAGLAGSSVVPWREIQDEMARMDERLKQELEAGSPEASRPMAAPPPPAPDFIFTGYVREAEFSLFKKAPPFQHRLVKGGKDMCALSSLKFDLNDYRGKMVGVSGYYEENPYSPDKILVVTKLAVFE